MKRLTATLREQYTEALKLDAAIAASLKDLGTGEWREATLGELGRIVNGKTPSLRVREAEEFIARAM